MKTITDYFGYALMLVQPSLMKNYFELRCGDDLIMTMENPKFFSTNSLIRFYDKEWEVKSESFWKNNILVFEKGKTDSVANAVVKFFKKTIIELPKGEKLFIKFGVWSGKISILTELEIPVATFKRKFSFKEKTEITIEQKHKTLDIYPWIIMLVLHIDIARRRRSHAAH